MRHVSTEYEVNETQYKRFHEKYNMIYRRTWDKTLSTYGKMFEKNIKKHIKSGKEGYNRIDFGLVAAGWSIYENFPLAFTWERTDTKDIGYGTDWMQTKYGFKNKESCSHIIKKAAKFFGASLVGIADINEKWIYKSGFVRPAFTSEAESKMKVRKGEAPLSNLEVPIDIPQGVEKVIVIAIEMDKNAISTAPAQPAAAAASLAYSKMAFLITCLGDFIRNLGYQAIQCGNDTALSIPLAIDAGLGALGRNGLLITPEYGPRVRICKIFTDLPLVSDQPNKSFIEHVRQICSGCYKCAEVCETDAISKEAPNFDNPTISNNPGVKKYYINAEKCFEFWIKNSSDCGSCIAVCPFSKIKKFLSPSEFWNEK